MFKDLKIGDEIIVVTVGNNARYKTSTYRVKVNKIGRKWFKVCNIDKAYLDGDQFSLETGYSDGKGYMSECRAFKSEKDYLESIERPGLIRSIQSQVLSFNYSELKQIEEYLNKLQNERNN